MSSLDPLSSKERQAVTRVLGLAEHVFYVAAPNPYEAARSNWSTAAAGGFLAVLGMPMAWLSSHAALSVWTSASALWSDIALPTLFSMITLPACLFGLYLACWPLAAWRKARDTLVLVTDRRVVILSIAGHHPISLPAYAIIEVERKKVDRGCGTLIIRHDGALSADGQTAETILDGLDNVSEAETAIQTLASRVQQGWSQAAPSPSRWLH